MQELAWDAFRSRNIFIGSSVATAVGSSVGVSRRKPTNVSRARLRMSHRDRCTPGGKAMVVIGYPLLLVGGIIGMLASGIVRSHGRASCDDSMLAAAYQKSRAVRWDPAGSRFVF